VYSDFFEIPLPALRFEKPEEINIKTDDTEEGTTISEEMTLGTLLIRKTIKKKQRFKKMTLRNDVKTRRKNDAHSSQTAARI
jgi:hypothetical protein